MAGAKKSGADGEEAGRVLPMQPFSRPVTPDEIIDRARQYGPACVDALADIAANGTDAARVSAAGALLDRGFGKVKQGVELSGSIKADVQVYRIPDNGRD